MRKRPFCFLCLLLLGLRAAVVLLWDMPQAEKLAGTIEEDIAAASTVTVTGTVEQIYEKETYQVLYIYCKTNQNRENSFPSSKWIVYDEQFQTVQIGDEIQVQGVVGYFSEDRNPGNFDVRLYYQIRGIQGKLSAKNLQVTKKTRAYLKEILHTLQAKGSRIAKESLGEKQGSVLAAIVLGERFAIDTELKELYQKNGIIHILAISGLHISLLGFGVYQIFRRLGFGFAGAGMTGAGVLFFYLLMVGVQVSVLRAFIMFLLQIGAQILGRVYDRPTALACSACWIVFWKPLYVLDTGFLLSYGAVTGITVLLPVLRRLFPLRRKWLQGLSASVAVQIALLPLLCYSYYEIPVYSLALNLVVVCLLSFLLPLGIVGIVGAGSNFWFLGQVGAGSFWICHWILSVYEKLCRATMKLPGYRLVLGKPAFWQIGVYYGILLLAVLWFYRFWRKTGQERWQIIVEGAEGEVWQRFFLLRKKQRYRTIALFVLLAMVMSFGNQRVSVFFKKAFGKGELTFAVLDVGQGDGIFLELPNGVTCLVDGGSSDVGEVGKYRLESFLLARGLARVDYVFVSHGDEDHISGIRELLERREVGVWIGCLVLPPQEVWEEKLSALATLAQKAGVTVAVMGQGESLTFGTLSITCLAPASDEGLQGNSASMVLSVSYGNFDLLLAGDIEQEGERCLLQELKQQEKEGVLPSYEVLKVAHHGSKNSTDQELLALLSPDIALISAGIDNSYGHPHAELLQRLSEAGAEIYSTQDCGAITGRTDGTQVSICSWVR